MRHSIFFFQFEFSFQVDHMSSLALFSMPETLLGKTVCKDMNSKYSRVSLKQCQRLHKNDCSFDFNIHHLYHLWDDRIREDIMGSVSITTIFTSHSTFTGEDWLVLFTIVDCLSGNAEHHTSNRICQRHSTNFRR